MKKAIFLAGLALLLVLAGCAQSKVAIDQYTWQLETVQSGEDGAVIACGQELAKTYPQAEVVHVTCTAQNGVLTLTDNAGQAYTGSYSLADVSPDGEIYTLQINGVEGYAGCAMTTYSDGRQEPTLAVSLDGYALMLKGQD